MVMEKSGKIFFFDNFFRFFYEFLIFDQIFNLIFFLGKIQSQNYELGTKLIKFFFFERQTHDEAIRIGT